METLTKSIPKIYRDLTWERSNKLGDFGEYLEQLSGMATIAYNHLLSGLFFDLEIPDYPDNVVERALAELPKGIIDRLKEKATIERRLWDKRYAEIEKKKAPPFPSVYDDNNNIIFEIYPEDGLVEISDEGYLCFKDIGMSVPLTNYAEDDDVLIGGDEATQDKFLYLRVSMKKRIIKLSVVFAISDEERIL